MRNLNFILIVAMVLLSLVACKKDEVNSNPDLEGTWVGTWGLGSGIPTNYEKWLIKPSNQLTAYTTGDVILANGIWHLIGPELKVEYTPFGLTSGLNYSGIYDKQLDRISGTWGWEPSHTDGGTFEMNKQ